jgi:hypothetical protein
VATELEVSNTRNSPFLRPIFEHMSDTETIRLTFLKASLIELKKHPKRTCLPTLIREWNFHPRRKDQWFDCRLWSIDAASEEQAQAMKPSLITKFLAYRFCTLQIDYITDLSYLHTLRFDVPKWPEVLTLQVEIWDMTLILTLTPSPPHSRSISWHTCDKA